MNVKNGMGGAILCGLIVGLVVTLGDRFLGGQADERKAIEELGKTVAGLTERVGALDRTVQALNGQSYVKQAEFDRHLKQVDGELAGLDSRIDVLERPEQPRPSAQLRSRGN